MENQIPMDHNHGFVPLREVLQAYVQNASAVDGFADELPLLTGYGELDSLIGGLGSGDLLVLGSGPGVGKTSLALNICVNVAKPGRVCGIVSPAMTREQVAMRMLVAESGVDCHRMRLGLLSQAEQDVISDVVGLLSALSIFIDDGSFQSVSDMRAKVQVLQSDSGLDFLVVDDMQSLHGAGGTRTEQVGDVARTLKGIARESKVPVLACSQLSRAVENRIHQRPQLDDLRDSGEIEESADVVVLLYREDMVFSEEEWKHHATGRPYPRNVVELIIAKNRQGPIGSSYLYFQQNVMKFGEFTRHEQSAA